MIKIFFTATIFLYSIAVLSQGDSKPLRVDMRGKQCNGGSSICSIVPDPLNRTQDSNMKNFTAFKTTENSIVLELYTNTLEKDDQIKFFGKEYSKISSTEELVFIQEEDYEFSNDALSYLNIDNKYKYLKKGRYPIIVVDDKVQVKLTLFQK